MTLATFDPTTLPRARSSCPRVAASVDTSNSGAEVPNPTTRAPIKMGDHPACPGEASGGDNKAVGAHGEQDQAGAEQCQRQRHGRGS